MSEPTPLDETGREALAPFLTAAETAFREWTGVETFVTSEFLCEASQLSDGRIVATIPLRRTPPVLLAVALSPASAQMLMDRVFAEAGPPAEGDLASDCVAELANLVAGHAKAILHGTADHFQLGTPSIGSPPAGRFAASAFASELGEWVVAIEMDA